MIILFQAELGKIMFKTPPKQFGKFKQLEPEYYEDLLSLLENELPISRRTVTTLQLTLKGNKSFFEREQVLRQE